MWTHKLSELSDGLESSGRDRGEGVVAQVQLHQVDQLTKCKVLNLEKLFYYYIFYYHNKTQLIRK